MAITTRTAVVLVPASQTFVDANSTPPFLDDLTPAEARKVLDDFQADPIEKLHVNEEWVTVPADVGESPRPTGAERGAARCLSGDMGRSRRRRRSRYAT